MTRKGAHWGPLSLFSVGLAMGLMQAVFGWFWVGALVAGTTWIIAALVLFIERMLWKEPSP